MSDENPTPADWLALGSATLGESGARPMAPRVKPVWAGARIAGPVIPVRCAPGDNLAIHVAVAGAAPGRQVLVVDASVVPELGYWGEVLTTAALVHDLGGLVIDGCVRDVDAIETHGFPVFSAGIALPGAKKERGGTVGVATQVAGAGVEPGDWVVGDRDGVVIVPHATMDDVYYAARARAAKENRMFEQLRAGSTTVQLLDLDPTKLDARE